MKMLVLMSTLLLLPVTALSVELSEVAVFNRCFVHLTRKAPKLNNGYLKKVISGEMSAEDACVAVLNHAKLGSNGVLGNKNDQIARDILNTFYAFHSQWFMNNDPNDSQTRINEGLVDPSPGSLYITRALFDPQFKYQDIFDGAKAYEAIRSEGRPSKNIFGRDKSKAQYPIGFGENNTNINRPNAITWSSLVFPQTGDLVGFKDEPKITSPGFQNNTSVGMQIPFNGSVGGGILGHRDYLMRTISTSIKSDGAIEMPRRFGRAIFHDFVCRELPVVDANLDTGAYVRPNSETPFRTNAGCVACHVSMDQVSGLVRHYETNIIGRVGSNNAARGRFRIPAGYGLDRDNKNQVIIKPYKFISNKYTWPANRDPNYYKRAPYGKFVYRTTDNKLISKEVKNFNALGNIFKNLDDTYKCAASRYVEFFTGVSYPVTQLSSGLKSNDPHATLIDSLSRTLKSTQDPMRVIKEIFASDIYKDANYGLSE